jgi:hypothetical protein
MGITPGWRLFRIISRLIVKLPPPGESFGTGFTDATSNCSLAGGACARKFAQIKAVAVKTTYRIFSSFTALMQHYG